MPRNGQLRKIPKKVQEPGLHLSLTVQFSAAKCATFPVNAGTCHSPSYRPLRYRLKHLGQIQVALARLWRSAQRSEIAAVRVDRTSAPSIGEVSALSGVHIETKIDGISQKKRGYSQKVA